MSIQVVDSVESLAKLVDHIVELPVSPPSLFVDLEGVKLSRQGSISIIILFTRPDSAVYLIDVYTLGATTFSTEGKKNQSLKSILESTAIPKVFFDVRNDSDALYSHFDIKLASVQDVQLMELGTRTQSKKYVNGLSKCITRNADMTPVEKLEWTNNKGAGLRLWCPDHGGTYEVFNERPLRADIIKYCAQDVIHLPQLWDTYARNLTINWRAKVSQATLSRVAVSQTPTYQPYGDYKSLGPWSD